MEKYIKFGEDELKNTPASESQGRKLNGKSFLTTGTHSQFRGTSSCEGCATLLRRVFELEAQLNVTLEANTATAKRCHELEIANHALNNTKMQHRRQSGALQKFKQSEAIRHKIYSDGVDNLENVDGTDVLHDDGQMDESPTSSTSSGFVDKTFESNLIKQERDVQTNGTSNPPVSRRRRHQRSPHE